ncbi:hypothetical protein Tco_1246413 [Tanacetum coccineum]
MDSYSDNDDYDPYDDDIYENHDLSEHLQSICDDLDITVMTAAAAAAKLHEFRQWWQQPGHEITRTEA